MSALGYLYTCAIRSRCPCCGRGALFRGWLTFRDACPDCGLVFEQWVGDWTTPTWIAHSAGFLTAMGLFAWMFITGRFMDGPVPPEYLVAGVAGILSLLFLRPSKAGWLGFLYWVGFVEVSAETRAWLHWFAGREPEPAARRRLAEAEFRARSPLPKAAPDYTRGGGLVPFLRDLFFPRPRRR